MKTAEIIGLVAVAYNKGVKSDDTRLEDQLVYTKLLTIRQRLITQQIKKHQKVSDWNYVILPCVEVIEVPSHDCFCLPDINCKIYRTKYQLPKALTDLNTHLISFVMSIDNGVLIDETSREEVLYSNGNKFTSHKMKYLLEQGYLYFPKKSPGVIKIKYLPENPLEVLSFPSLCPCTDCDNCIDIMDTEFPIDGDMIDALIEMTKESLIQDFKIAIEDQTNNNKDSQQEQSK